MMKNLVKVLVVSLVMVLAVAILFSSGVNASDSFVFPTANNTGNMTPLTSDNSTNTANTAVTNTATNTATFNAVRNTTKVNDIGSEKEYNRINM